MNRTEIARQTLAAQTVAELRDLALDAELRGFRRLRKAELVELLIPTQLAEMALVEANRADAVSRETPAPHPTDSLVSAAIRARDAYQEVAARCGQENGGPAVSIAWEDYLDACVAAEVCARTDCWDRATDGDGRCGRHSWGPALGQDVAPSEPEAVSRETEPTEVRTPADVWARVQAAKEAAMAELKSALPQSGYTDCACRDCFDAAISSDVTRPEPCLGCVESECELGDSECNQPGAYGE